MRTKAEDIGSIILISLIVMERMLSHIFNLDKFSKFLSLILLLYLMCIVGYFFFKRLFVIAGIILAFFEVFVGIWSLLAGLNPLVYISIIMIGTISLVFLFSADNEETRSDILSDAKSDYIIEVVDVYKDYVTDGNVVHALRGITLKVRRGEFVAIMGPSGSGKSTLLNIIGALDRPTKGKVYIEGIDLSKLDDVELSYLRNKKIGFVFQAFNLINRTTVLRNIEMPAIVAGVPRRKRIKRVKELIKIMGLDESMLYRRPTQLSGGQQQRVAIARALMNDPPIILADEPTGNLDSKTGHEVMKYLRMLNEKFGKTIIVVTHDRSIAQYADRILHIRDGRIVKEEVLRKR